MGEHRNPNWTGRGRLVRVALAAGRINNQGSAYRRCPLCRGIGAPLDPAAVMAAALAERAARQPIPSDPDRLAAGEESP